MENFCRNLWKWLVVLSLTLSLCYGVIVSAFGAVSSAKSSRNYSYPILQIYNEYEVLIKNFKEQTDASIQLYLQRFEKSPLQLQLLNRWLTHLAISQQWQRFLQWTPNPLADFNFSIYKNNMTSSLDLECWRRIALVETGDLKKGFMDVTNLWLKPYNYPNSCHNLFKFWQQQGYLSEELILQRFKMALDVYNYALASYLFTLLPSMTQSAWLPTWQLVIRPELLPRSNPNGNWNNGILVYAFSRLIKSNPELALSLWQQWDAIRQFNPEQKAIVVGSFGVKWTLRQQMPLALSWFQQIKIPLENLNEEPRSWWIRAALSQQQWQIVKQLILTAPSDFQKQAIWQYWFAVAAFTTGDKVTANTLWRQLLAQQNYYGFLSAGHLQIRYPLQNHIFNFSPEVKNQVENYPAIQRAKLFRALNSRGLAHREWQYALQHFNATERYLAARLAFEWGWLSEAIWTMNKISDESENFSHHLINNKDYQNDLIVRFPTPYYTLIQALAKERGLNISFIYALIRQESTFRPDVRSHAGAWGLMQLMPRTALVTAQRHKVPYKNTFQLLDSDKNLQLGIRHLKDLSTMFNTHYALMAAAYNAGSTRVRKWLPPEPLPVTIWIETIPWQETRDYVKNTISFSVFYQFLLSEPVAWEKFFEPVQRR